MERAVLASARCVYMASVYDSLGGVGLEFVGRSGRCAFVCRTYGAERMAPF